MSVFWVSYEEFLERAQQSPRAPFEPFVKEEKTVYVYALTRDLCSGCETQKPLYEALSNSITHKYGDRVKFNAIHVSQQEQFRKRIRDFRELLKFAAYPTYLIFLKTEFGAVEIYRGIEPPMDEIARNIDIAMDLANR